MCLWTGLLSRRAAYLPSRMVARRPAYQESRSLSKRAACALCGLRRRGNWMMQRGWEHPSDLLNDTRKLGAHQIIINIHMHAVWVSSWAPRACRHQSLPFRRLIWASFERLLRTECTSLVLNNQMTSRWGTLAPHSEQTCVIDNLARTKGHSSIQGQDMGRNTITCTQAALTKGLRNKL